MPAATNQPSENGWQDKVYQWGLGLIAIGLVGLICPTFGWQLRRLQALGEMQWVVLIVVVTVGCGAVLWSRRQQLKLGVMITGGALSAMLVFAYLSFWRHAGDAPVAQEAPRNSKNDNPPSEIKLPLASGDERAERHSDSAPVPPTTAPTPEPPREADPSVGPSSAIGSSTPATPPTTEPPEPKESRTAANVPTQMLAGRGAGNPFEDESPPGGLLVGLRCAKGKNWGGALQAVQPIYQVGAGYVLGQRHGAAGGDEEQLLAKPGYAIGAIRARAGLVLNAVQLAFYRIQDQRLDPNDHYETPWIGCDGGSPFDMDGRGAPITGLFGTWHEDIVSLGLKPVVHLSSPIPLASEPPPDLTREPRPGTVLGSTTGTAVIDSAPEGGVLVGVRAFCDTTPRQTLRSLQPIYIHGDRYVEGRRHGDGGTLEILAVARPGFTVSGIGLTVGGDVCGLRLKFKKLPLADGGATDEEYESQWLGYTFDRPAEEANTGDRVAAGLISYCDTQPRGLGLMLIGSQAVNLTSLPELPKEYRSAAYARPPLRAGGESGKPFQDVAPDGGLLVGLRCAKGKNWGGALQAVQPVYQVGTGYVMGQRHGTAGGDEQQLLAKPGYAVGAIHARAGLVLNAVQLSFYRINGLRLDPGDHYESPWIGSDGGGSFDLDAKGDPITGIFGTWVEDLVSLGCSPTANMLASIPLAEGSPSKRSTAKAEPREFRQWTSSDGTSTVEAKMIGKAKDGVRLERRDGKVVTVPLARLSASDIAYVRSQQ